MVVASQLAEPLQNGIQIGDATSWLLGRTQATHVFGVTWPCNNSI